MAKSEVVRCRVVEMLPVGLKFWHSIDNPEGDAIFMVDEGTKPTVKADVRKNPPFYQILPCPYCGVEEDKNHNPLDHVDPRFGKPVDGSPIHNYIEDKEEKPWSPYGRHDVMGELSEADEELLKGEPVPLTILVPNIKIEG